MMRGRRKPLHLILDGLPAHKALAVKEYVAGLDGKLTVHYLPGYAPDSTPMSWSGVMRSAPATHAGPCRRGERLADRMTAQLTEMAHCPALIRSFFRHPRVAYISAC